MISPSNEKKINEPDKPSLWERFTNWCWTHDFLEKLLSAILILAFVGFAVFFSWLLLKPEAADSVTKGVIVDMGHYNPGKYAKQYSCWVVVESADGVKATWDISDSYYETLEIGDEIQKRRTGEDD